MRFYSTFFLLSLICTLSIYGQIDTPELQKGATFVEHRCMPLYNLKKQGNTTIFQGNKKKKKYFEGWYFKMVGDNGTSIISIIPGISLSKDDKEQHAFIQIINGLTAETSYHYYPIEDFSFSRKEFAIKIADNYFSKEKVILNINDKDINISGEITLSNITQYSNRTIGKRKIMGWYRKIPFMQCYHGVVSLTHNLEGTLTINNELHHFDFGKGYIEKDWGSSMPSSWIWIQSNHFEHSNSSFMISVADVPFLGKSFTGFLGFFYHENEVYRFATYRHSKISMQLVDENTVSIKIQNRKESLEIEATRNSFGLLKAPLEGSMDRRIPESIDAHLKIKLLDQKGKLLYSDESNITGFEIVGDIKALIEDLK